MTGSPISDFGYASPYAPYGVPMRRIRTSVGGLAIAVTVFLALDGVFALLLTAAMAWRHALLSRLQEDPTSVSLDTGTRSDHLVASSAGLLVLAYLGTIVLFICWFWAARNNAEVYAPDEGAMGIGWSIGGWFIPLANYVIPFIVARDVYKGTMSRRRDKPRNGGQITGWWWAAYVVSGISLSVMRLVGRQSADPIDNMRMQREVAGIAEFAMPCLAIAAVLAIVYVWTITKTQKARNATGDWPGGPGSATGPGGYAVPAIPYGYGAPAGQQPYSVPHGYGAPVAGYPMPNPVPTQDAPVQDKVQAAETQAAETQTAGVVNTEESEEPGERPETGLVPPS